jgi:ribosomal protein L44E
MSNESLLKKEFKERDVQRLRNLVSKNHSDKTVTQVGYTKEQVDRKEGDVWEENSKTWTIKNGIKMTITKLDLVKSTLQIPLTCPECKRAMNKGRLDKHMYGIHKKCSDCVISHETELKRIGKFEEYQKSILSRGIEYHIREMEDVLLELSLGINEGSFVTENGDIEEWKGKGVDEQEMIKGIQEYIQKLKDSIR